MATTASCCVAGTCLCTNTSSSSTFTFTFTQAPLDLSGLTGRDSQQHGGVQPPPLPQQQQPGGLQLPVPAPGMYAGSGPYGVTTPNGTFELLHHQHPMAHGLPAGMGAPQVLIG
jgi:hypothetical protein